MKQTGLLFLALAFTSITGCSSISSKMAYLHEAIKDQPKLVVTDELGTLVYQGTTPATLQLRKQEGSALTSKRYNMEITIDGVITQNVQLRRQLNGWYLAGNMVSDGPIGWLVVNPRNGELFLLPSAANGAPRDINYDPEANEGSISIVMKGDYPPSMSDKLVKLERQRGDRTTTLAAFE